MYKNAFTNRILFVSDYCACPAGRRYQHRFDHKLYGIMLFSNTLPSYQNYRLLGFARLASTSDGASNISHVINHGCCVMPPWSVALRK